MNNSKKNNQMQENPTMWNKSQIKAFFETLIENCFKTKETYSVIDEVKKMGIPYKLVKKWSKSNNYCRDLFEMCKEACACHVEEAAILGKLSSDQATEYMAANNTKLKKPPKKEEKEIVPQKTFKLESHMDKKEVAKKEITETIQYTEIEKQRVEQYKKKAEKNQTDFKLTIKAKSENRVELKEKYNKEGLTEEQKAELYGSTIHMATGSTGNYATNLISSAMSAFIPVAKNDESKINAFLEGLVALNPMDETEGMLCSRLLVLHEQYMTFLGRTCLLEQTEKGIDLNVNRSAKLIRLYNETLETLNRYRRKGEQRVVVQHVNVNSGGQAIVGSEIKQGGGANEKK